MPRSEDDILREIRERYSYAEGEWAPIREQGRIDMRYVAGDPWDPKARAVREAAKRPCLALDELQQYFNQTINDVRANPRAIKFAPRGGGASEGTARFYQEKTREIEYRSKGQLAYITAFENAVQRSYGFARVITKYADRSFNQDIWLQPVPNPDLITADPDAQRPDGLDQEFAFVEEWRAHSEFLRQPYETRIRNFDGETWADAPTWLRDGKVRIAEYWTIERRSRKLVGYTDPQQQLIEAFEDELPKGALRGIENVRTRVVDWPEVAHYLTNGIELLRLKGETEARRPWPGRYIPIVWCLGKVLYVPDGAGGGAKRHILSMTRLARDPAKLYCYYRTCEAEVVGRVPKIPAVGYEGQFAGHETDWQASIHEPKAYLEVKPTTEVTGGQILPLPQMQTWEPPIQALEIGAESARRAIQAAMGISPLPTSALRRNEKSGRALQQIEATQQKGSFHFVDHYVDLIEACGVVIEDLMDKVYDTARDVGIRQADDTAKVVRINDPRGPDGLISTKGDHEVTVNTGPPSDSEREEAQAFADSLVAIPPVFARVADLIVKLKNLGPIGDQIADRLTPPEYRQAQNGQMDPQAMVQELAGTKQKLAEVEGVAAQMKQALDIEEAKQRAALEQARIKADTELEKERMSNATAIRVAEISAAVKGYTVEAQHRAAHEAQAGAEVHEAAMAATDAAQQQDTLRMQHQQAVDMADRQHQQALEAGQVEHQHALEQGEQGIAGQVAVAQSKPAAVNEGAAE